MRPLKKRSVAVGLVAILVLGGVALAVVLGQARVNDNSIRSTEFPPEDVLTVALVPYLFGLPQPCTVGTYEAISSSQLFSDSVMGSNITAFANRALCVRNETNVALRVSATTERVHSEEVRGCPDQYESAAGDTTCGPGEGEFAQGELLIHYNDAVTSDPGPNGTCDLQTSAPLVEGGTVTPLAQLDPSGFCAFEVSISGNPDVTDFAPSSTDTIVFDIALYGDDTT